MADWFGPTECPCDCEEPGCGSIGCLDASFNPSSTTATRLAVTMSGLSSSGLYLMRTSYAGFGPIYAATITGLDWVHGTYIATRSPTNNCIFSGSGEVAITRTINLYEVVGLTPDGCPVLGPLENSFSPVYMRWGISWFNFGPSFTIGFNLFSQPFPDGGLLVSTGATRNQVQCAGGGLGLIRDNFYEVSPGVPCAGYSANLAGTSTYAFLP